MSDYGAGAGNSPAPYKVPSGGLRLSVKQLLRRRTLHGGVTLGLISGETPVPNHGVAVPAGGALNHSGLLMVALSIVGGVPSGGDRMAMELARRWPTIGGPITVLTTIEGVRLIHDLEISNVNTQVLTGLGTSSRMVSLAYFLRTLISPIAVLRAIRGARPRIVLSATLFPPDVVAALVARALGASWVHSWQLVIPPPGRGYQLTGRRWSLQRPPSPVEVVSVVRHGLSYLSQNLSLLFARRWCKTLVVPTQLMASVALQRGFKHDQIHVANYGIDLAEVENGIAHRATAWNEHCDGIFVGQFRAQKGLADLVDVWKRVQERLPLARLAVVGDGTGLAAAQFKSQLKEFRNGTVSLLGVIS